MLTFENGSALLRFVNINTESSAITERRIGECVADVLGIPNLRRATAYISDKLTIKATAQRRTDKRNKSVTVLVTVGRPNFLERKFIKVCKDAGCAFPLRQVQHKFWKKK